MHNPEGGRVGFKGRTYDSIKGTLYGYDDRFADYWEFLEPRLAEAWRLLDDQGTLYLPPPRLSGGALREGRARRALWAGLVS